MRYTATVASQPLAGVTDKGDGVVPGMAGKDSEESRQHALDFIAIAHGYGDFAAMQAEIPEATDIVLTPVEES